MYRSRETCHLARAPRQPSGDEHLAGSLLVAFRPACTVGSEMSTLRRKLLEGVKREQNKHAGRWAPSEAFGEFRFGGAASAPSGLEELILDNVESYSRRVANIAAAVGCQVEMGAIPSSFDLGRDVAVLMPPPRLIARGLRPEDKIGLARRAGRDEYASRKSGAGE
ncbi:hypothetical protein DFH09DRAFT_1075831 [Mycena vulgaris]|nr:hypothetical protein DFH09DRAFT_1075831 [Mycena vulgaris]